MRAEKAAVTPGGGGEITNETDALMGTVVGPFDGAFDGDGGFWGGGGCGGGRAPTSPSAKSVVVVVVGARPTAPLMVHH